MSKVPTSADLIKTLHNMAWRADTSYVIVAGTALEELLETALLAQMRDLSNTVYLRMFTGNGSLSHFSAKIDLAYSLQLINEDVTIDFHAIRNIRNQFAHAKQVIHFESEDLQSSLQKLRGWKKGSDGMKLFDATIESCTMALEKHIENAIFAKTIAR